MKTIILLTAEISKPYSFQKDYAEYYEKLAIIWLKENIKIISSWIFDYNEKENNFKWWTYFDWEKWIEEKNIIADMVWCKANIDNYLIRLIEKNNKFLNPVDYISFANDKYITSLFFKEESPETFLLWTYNKNDILSEELILKPNWWSWWEWVIKIKNNEIKKYFWWKYDNYLVQELIDSSAWIKWVADGLHDIRFTLFWDKVWDIVLLRTPPKWDFRCNISAGWLWEYIKETDLPKDMLEFIRPILDKILNRFWKIFWSIDILKSNWRYYIMEFNSSPWINTFKFNKKLEKEYFEDIIRLLKNY